jgi:type II secretion system protein G
MKKGFKRLQKASKGFTLIELLVVVAIIGILSTIVISSLSQARSRARDAARERDIKTIQTALEVYHLDNGHYPRVNHTYNATNWSELETALGITLPRDPLDETGDPGAEPYPHNYGYRGWSSPSWCLGQDYRIIYNKENSIETGRSPWCSSGLTGGYGDAFMVTAPR